MIAIALLISAVLISGEAFAAPPAHPSAGPSEPPALSGKATAERAAESGPRAGGKSPKASPPAPKQATFDSTRAFRYLLEQCALGPRNPGSEGHRRAIEYFSAHFKSLGLSARLQAFAHKDMTTGKTVNLTNIIATVPGKDPKRKPAVFCAHWDTRPRADMEASLMMKSRPIIGANDGASGVAVIMELANALKKTPPAQTVYLVLFDGEDYGHEGNIEEYFLGARHFAENLPAKDIEYALLFDMVGDKNLSLPMEQNSLKQSPELVRKIWARAALLGLKAFQPRVGPNVLDDHIPHQAKGIPAVDIIDFEYPYWHTLADTPDKCSAHSLGVVGRLAESLAIAPP